MPLKPGVNLDSQMNTGRLLIVDGHAYAYRAFHAIRELRSPTGQPTNAIFGFVKMLAKMRAVVEPTHLMVVWDGGLSAERLAALPEYKAQRPEMPADLKPQLDGMTGYLQAAGIASFCQEGVEADDYIAGLARRAAEAGLAVVIASSDKDFMQLVSGQIGLLNPNDKTETIWTEEQVRGKTGVRPSQVVDWLSLTGDSVDNIPGVPGVGPKTATELLNRFGSVDALFERVSEVKSEKLAANLRAAEAAVRRNQELVRLRDDLPCAWSPEALAEKPADAGRLRVLYRRWGFKTLLAALGEEAQECQAVLI
ncbi:MAG TPA: 5'-3' exonuclease H3TH domain-containing protein [Candidatus Acidoferrales bacterium]|nr:5'-3' exonuclease H3TH domain-containing protein [Candidatus Acidoferrales bacterium]